MAGGGHNYVFMSGRGPWASGGVERGRLYREQLALLCNDSSFPCVGVFLNSARHRAFVSPTSLLYLPAWAFIYCTGGLNVVLLRDAYIQDSPKGLLSGSLFVFSERNPRLKADLLMHFMLSNARFLHIDLQNPSHWTGA